MKNTIILSNTGIRNLTFASALFLFLLYNNVYSVAQTESTVMSQEKSSCFMADLMVSDLRLKSSDNVDRLLGADIMDRLGEAGFNEASILSADRSQELVVVFSPGDIAKEFSGFKIREAIPAKSENIPVSEIEDFVTESGIKLGMSKAEILALNGEPTSIENDILSKLQYRIADAENSALLQEYNQYAYVADYYFHGGKLVEFHFGFEYP